MKKLKKIAILILVTTMLILSNNGVAYAYESYIIKCEAKLSNDLKVSMDATESNEIIPVAIWCEEADLSNVENEAFKQIGITEEYFYGLKDSGMDANQMMEIVQNLIMAKRSIIKTIYEKQNSKYVDSLGLDTEVEYYSSYAPVLTAKASVKEINSLSRKSDVTNIFLDDYENVMEMDISRSVVRANTMQNSAMLGYTGEGVNVGIFEAANSGVPDNSLVGLPEEKFETEMYYNNRTDDHANIIAMIIAGQGLNGNSVGIAPDASLFSTYSRDGSFYERIEWLLQQGVNIINMSFGFEATNIYSMFDIYIDYVAYQANVIFVTSSGNENVLGVTSPGLAYNAITVANIDDKNTKNISDDLLNPPVLENNEYKNGSSYINSLVIHTASKPDISAPGTDIYTTEYGNQSGTSYAAPHITGLAALLGEQNPMLLYVPAAMKAVLTAGVSPSNHAYVPSQRVVTSDPLNPASSYIQYGAGIANCVGSATIVMNESFDFGYFLENTTTGTYTIECTENENVRVSLSFLKNLLYFDRENRTYSGSLPNLDLFVYDSSGNLVGSSVTTYNNLEIVDFEATYSGNYTVRISRVSETGEKVYYGIAWT